MLFRSINRANLLAKSFGSYEQALADYDLALALAPGDMGALVNRGNVLVKLRRFEEAIASFDRGLAAAPGNIDALNNRVLALKSLGRFEEALAGCDRALAINPNNPEILLTRGNALFDLNRYGEAVASYERALAIKPDLDLAPGANVYSRMIDCDWRNYDELRRKLIALVREGRLATSPFVMLGVACTAEDQRKCAEILARDDPAVVTPLWRGERYAHERIRVAYVSADFREHPVSHLLAGLFEAHDRARFETMAISLGADDGSEVRARMMGAFERFVDARGKSDADVARAMRALEVDIAIDLMGYTMHSRPALLAHRPAPIQVNYLGFAGTMGADHIDYIVGDRVVIPEGAQQYFSERVAYLPDTYFPYDSKRTISEQTPTRTEAGLPETGLVFCAYNNSYKITPQIFDVWMRLLLAVDGSVLWLSGTNASAMRNLQREATARGIDAGRLRFASRQKRMEDHLARLRLADLFLDTLPYGAHTTASDALWAGLPVLTCRGETFAGRVAASLLNAVGLPEMVTENLADYEALALKLAREPVLLAAIKAKLARNRDTCALFDTARFARHIEAAYATMWEIWQRGEAPRSFSVEPVSTPMRQ